MTRVVLVTGMGGNVAQGIVRCIRAMEEDIRIVGTNTERPCAGSHLVDAMHLVPLARDEGYIPALRKVCDTEAVDLIIPATDYETHALACNRDGLPVVAVSDTEATGAFLDKWQTFSVFSRHDIPFAESLLPRDYNGQFDSVVVKPREGRGSRDVHVDPPEPRSFSDDFVVQKRYRGQELTSAFYVRRDGVLHGTITMRRTLTAGTTTACEVTFDYEGAVEALAASMAKALPIRGSCNLQSIVDEEGRLVPFEINGRLSGTTSIRSQFGFEDARWTVEEYLFNREPSPPRVRRGSALRLLMDVVYPDTDLKDIQDRGTPHFLF